MGGVDKGLVTELDPKKDLRLIRFIYKHLSESFYGKIFHSVIKKYFGGKNCLPSIEIMAVCLKEFEFCAWNNSRYLLMLGKDLRSFDKEASFLEGKKLDNGDVIFPVLNKTNDAKLKQFFRAAFYMSCLSDFDFDWIDTGNDRQCHFVWGAIRTMRENPRSYDESYVYIKPVGSYYREVGHFSIFEFGQKCKDEYGDFKYLFDQCCDDFNTEDNKRKKSKIIEFFDLIGGNLEQKRELNEFLKDEWAKRVKNIALISWLKKNEELSIWAYNYTLNTYLNGIHRSWMQVDRVNDAKYSAFCRMSVIAFFDLLPNEREQQNFLDKIRRNGRQQKAREKLKRIKDGKCESAINISKDVYDKLKFIAQLRDCKKEDVVEQLINHFYAELKEKSAIGK